MKWLVGVDEAGRGPLAGPVSVGVVAVPVNFDWRLLEGVGDSKTVKPSVREHIFKLTQKLRQDNNLNFSVSMVGAKMIDKYGITTSVSLAIKRGLMNLSLNPEDCEVRLDGLLKAPVVYKKQKTIIKGDSLEAVIGLASILAKVTRDRHMARLAKQLKFSPYKFEKNKGYGTKNHLELIARFGLSDIHRKSFCKGLLA